MQLLNQTQTTVKEFIIVGFPGLPPEYDQLMGTFLFLLYVMSAAGNLLLVVLFFVERRLQKPMYIVMLSLALSDIGLCTTTLPKAVSRYWLDDATISFHTCHFQRFLVHYFGTLSSLIMMTMSVDRYLAVCFPLRYPMLMTNRIIVGLTVFSWASATASPGGTARFVSQMSSCGPNRVLQCYCDSLGLTQLICGDKTEVLHLGTSLAMCVLQLPLSFIIFSYFSIVVAVLKIADEKGRYKTFSTCATQVCIIALYYLPRFFVYILAMLPSLKVNTSLRICLTFSYTLFPPLINPFIYCFRTNEIKELLQKWFCQRNGVSQKPAVVAVSNENRQFDPKY